MQSLDQRSHDPSDKYRVFRADQSDLRKLLRLTLSGPHQPAFALEYQITGFIEYARAMKIDLSRNWWCHHGSKAVSACTCLESAGHSGMLMVPFGGTDTDHPLAFEGMLKHVLEQETKRGIKIIQCLLRPEDQRGANLLASQEFQQIAELIYLERTVRGASNDLGDASPKSEFEWACYDETRHQLFADTIELTYDGSMDCRGLSGLREIEDIIAAHKGAGLFVPQHWILLLIGSAPAGCILLAENPLDHHGEVAYMGVCPDFRGRRLGRALMHRALELAHHAGMQKLTLAVDSANAPARKVYESLNFTETTRRSAWVRVLNPNPNLIRR